jgi:hypothetical protein
MARQRPNVGRQSQLRGSTSRGAALAKGDARCEWAAGATESALAQTPERPSYPALDAEWVAS